MKRNLRELSLTDLKSLYELLTEGFVDGRSTQRISIEAEGFQYGHEKWKERKEIRSKQLRNIEKAIQEKASEYDF